MKKNLNIVFIGMGRYTIGALEALIENGFKVVGIIQSVRKKETYSLWDLISIKMGSLRKFAKKRNISYMYTDNLNDFSCTEFLKEKKCNLLCVASAGQLLKGEILKYPEYGVMNAHSSLLPQYRGANPSYWVIRNQENFGGVTIHYIDEGMDSGDILFQKKFEIPRNISYQDYDKTIAKVAGECYVTVLNNLCDGNINRQQQQSYDDFIARRIKESEYKLDFKNMNKSEVCHYLYGTDALNHIYKSGLFSYKINEDTLKNSKFQIECQDGIITVEKIFNFKMMIRHLVAKTLSRIRIKNI
ncbi:MAG: hypothetical protein E7258_02975 [Lachnospiraceae bacterium]|nr:hypothetical protein [Lachnospiraceae bacterium]